MENHIVKPFLKWAGGKRQILNQIRYYYPFNDTYNKYVEPFVGGGAVLFDILSRYNLSSVYISDVNEELINTYKVICSSSNELIKILLGIEDEYNKLSMNDRRNYYLEKRDKFNLGDNIEIIQASLMLFLNKTCFNGLYRVNQSGKFNVPFGRYNKLSFDIANLISVSKKLQNITIVCCDYKQNIEYVDEHTFVYLDPPYRPVSKTSFINYTKEKFSDKEQRELAGFVNEINDRGGKFLLSNSNQLPCDDCNFFDELYKGYDIVKINANRSINSDGNNRGYVKEILVSNINDMIANL